MGIQDSLDNINPSRQANEKYNKAFLNFLQIFLVCQQIVDISRLVILVEETLRNHGLRRYDL